MGGNTYGSNRRGNFGGGNTSANRGTASAAANTERVEPLLEKFVNTSKSGKALTLYSGDEGFTIPPKTRIVIAKLTDKQVAGLTRVGKEKGYKTVPTHKLMVFPADSNE